MLKEEKVDDLFCGFIDLPKAMSYGLIPLITSDH